MEAKNTPSTQPSIEEYLEDANTASASARTAWLAWVGLLAYFIVILSGVDHSDLLLNNAVKLPIVLVDIPLFSFFIAGPVLVVLFHIGFMTQHATLAQKYEKFSEALFFRIKQEELGQDASSAIEELDTKASKDLFKRIKERHLDHPLRNRVNGYVFSQVVAGPRRHGVVHYLLRSTLYLTITILPIFVLLMFQVTFLPYHDQSVTWFHRIVLLFEFALLWLLPPFEFHIQKNLQPKLIADAHWFGGIERTGKHLWWSGILTIVSIIFAFTIAILPDEPMDKLLRNETSCNKAICPWFATAFFFEGEIDKKNGDVETLFGWSRNLVIRHKDIVPGKENEKVESRLNLRGRNLNYANLDGSDLHGADFSYAKLNHSSLVRTRLFDAEFSAAELRHAQLRSAHMNEVNLECADLTSASLEKTRLREATLTGVNLTNASLIKTRLQKANLTGANLRSANLTKTDLRGAIWIDGKPWSEKAILSTGNSCAESNRK